MIERHVIAAARARGVPIDPKLGSATAAGAAEASRPAAVRPWR